MTTPHARNDPADHPYMAWNRNTGNAIHADDGKVLACPVCDGVELQFRLSKSPAFRCPGCGEEFEEPRRRQTKPAGRSAKGSETNVARELFDMDPADIAPTVHDREGES